jgi:hypothetical protein
VAEVGKCNGSGVGNREGGVCGGVYEQERRECRWEREMDGGRVLFGGCDAGGVFVGCYEDGVGFGQGLGALKGKYQWYRGVVHST